MDRNFPRTARHVQRHESDHPADASDIFDLFDRLSDEIAAAIAAPNQNTGAVLGLISRTAGEACSDVDSEHPAAYLEPLFHQISIAHGLHKSASEAGRQRQEGRAEELHEMAQLFLFYAIGSIQGLYDTAKATLTAADTDKGTVH